jgi:transcriptional regulator with XRE-family HTH domain
MAARKNRASALLRQWRGQMSQRQAAKLLGMTQGRYCELEHGHVPSLARADEIEKRTRGKVKLKDWVTR